MGDFERSPALQSFMNKAKLISVSKGETLPSSDEHQPFFMVKTGFIKRYLISNTGNLGVQIVYGPSDVFPLTVAYRVLLNQSIYKGPEVYHYRALKDSELYALDVEHLREAAETNPQIYQELFSEAGQHLESCIQRLENASLANAQKRLAHQLLFFARRFGEAKKNGVRISVPFTQQDLADILSLTRETVSVSFTQLKKLGLVKANRLITVPDIDKLEEEAYS